MNNANMLRNIKWYFFAKRQQSGAEEACWAHDPEVGGSKPPAAICKNFHGSMLYSFFSYDF